jgi:hypothetical protein
MEAEHVPQYTLCPFDYALCLGFTLLAVALSPSVRSKVRSNLFLRTFFYDLEYCCMCFGQHDGPIVYHLAL